MNMTPYDLYHKAPYPVVIFMSRYQGTYSGGLWVGLHAFGIPPGAVGSDLTCVDWWQTWGKHQAVAVGSTPDDVLTQLIARNLKFEDILPREAFEDKTDELYERLEEAE